jgi:prepilin-type N-terminal cleavage/methylation domain-containing protein
MGRVMSERGRREGRGGRGGRGRAGFTLIELLVVVAIIALLISILLPSLGKAKEAANRVYCAANMRGVGFSMQYYGEENNSQFPACRAPAAPGAYVNGFTPTQSTMGPNQLDTLALAVTDNQGNVLTSFWIMALRGLAPPKMLVCKSDPFVVGPASLLNGNYYANFQDSYQISYSITYPWNPQWRSSLKSEVPLASDMAPLSDGSNKDTLKTKGQTTKLYNTSSHGDIGQNVLFGDDHVEFVRDPYVGQQNDSIFTYDSGGRAAAQLNSTGGGVPGPMDTVMVPVRGASGQMGQ